MRKRYILIVEVKKELEIAVGSLGEIRFKKGYYAYVGSGGVNVLKRIKRHFSETKRIKWHIDYITSIFPPYKAYIVINNDIDEVTLSRLLEKQYTYIPYFGSSDTKDKSHLFYIGSRKDSVYKLRDYVEKKSIFLLKYCF